METSPTMVDVFTNEITFELNYPSNSELTFSRVSPSGDVIDTSTSAPNVEYVKGTAHQYYRIVDPEVGEWLATVKGENINTATPYSMLAFGNSDEVSTYAGLVKSTFTYPEPVIIRASVYAGEPVTGVKVTGEVVRPNNTTTTIQLYDNGDPANGDETAGDGIYSAVFNDFAGAGSGSYTFKLTIHNDRGTESDKSNLPFVEEGCDFDPQQVPTFVRVEEFSTVINNVPEVLVMKEFNIDFARIVFKHEHRVYVQGNFVLNDNSNGFNPVNEDVVFKVGDFVTAIPPNSFQIVEGYRRFKLGAKDTTIYLYQSADGKENMYIVTVDGINGLFGYAGVGMDMSSTYARGPEDVPIELQIGDDLGRTAIDMKEIRPRRWEYGKRVRLSDFHDEGLLTEGEVPLSFGLAQNYPNPFNPETRIPFSVAERSRVTIQVFDVNGKLVQTLFEGYANPGTHWVVWKGQDDAGNNVASGVYIYRMTAISEKGKQYTFNSKMMLFALIDFGSDQPTTVCRYPHSHRSGDTFSPPSLPFETRNRSPDKSVFGGGPLMD